MTHQAVLLKETIDALAIDPKGKYVDATFGRGGHSSAILAKLGSSGKLLVIDKDPDAIAVAERLQKTDSRVTSRHGSFGAIKEFCEELGWQGQVDGILMDLGVSSPQLDQAERGFSFRQDGPLDMRMDTTSGESAADWLNRAPAQDIARVLKQYGEERFARRIAQAIVDTREQQPIKRTGQLVELIKKAMPRIDKNKHPATRSFQAIRIYINRELDDLKQALEGSLDVLAENGRLVVISFHSLEDRIVKKFIQNEERDPLPAKLPVRGNYFTPRLKKLGKSIVASQHEIDSNVRARSARVRVAIKPQGGDS